MGRNNFTAFIYGRQSGRCVGSRKPKETDSQKRKEEEMSICFKDECI